MAESLLLLLCMTALQLTVAEDIIQKPIKEGKQEVALILLQGAQIPPDRYIPLTKAIQLASEYTLWVGIPQYPLDMVEPLVIGNGIKRVLETMKSQGMTSNSSLFLAGHSLGGAMLQDYVQDNSTGITGQILMGSFIERKHYNQSYKVSTLTIGGELDGLCHVTRIMESYYHFKLNPSPQINTDHFPVTVVMGMSHMQFASGSPPLLVKERDLKPEIPDDQAHSTVANITAAYIATRLNNTQLTALHQWTQQTTSLLLPLLDAFKFEGYYYFKPPCYDNPPSSYCTTGCPWSEQVAQSIMGGLEDNKLRDIDAFHPVSQINPIHLPKILNKCTLDNSSCVLQTTTVSQCIYEEIDKIVDAGFFPSSASEIRVKLSSRQNVMEAAGMGKLDFNKTDGGSICKTINEYTYQWAMNRSANTTLARFKKIGEPMVFGEDKGPYNAGPLWIYNPLEYKRIKDGNGNTVQQIRSPMMRTPVDYFVKLAAGFHYCKLLSPARAMEWMYVDGLRLHGSLSSSN